MYCRMKNEALMDHFVVGAKKKIIIIRNWARWIYGKSKGISYLEYLHIIKDTDNNLIWYANSKLIRWNVICAARFFELNFANSIFHGACLINPVAVVNFTHVFHIHNSHHTNSKINTLKCFVVPSIRIACVMHYRGFIYIRSGMGSRWRWILVVVMVMGVRIAWDSFITHK